MFNVRKLRKITVLALAIFLFGIGFQSSKIYAINKQIIENTAINLMILI